MKFFPLIMAASLLITATSCGVFKKKTIKDENMTSSAANEDRLRSECPEDLICTMDFRAIAVEVDVTGKQLVIDEARMLFPEAMQNKIKQCKMNTHEGKLAVILANDSDMGHFSKNGTRVKLQLRSKGEVIVEKDYTIGHDCCHIKLISGDKEIKL